MQVGFIDFICMPVYSMFYDLEPCLKPLYNGCLDNRKNWKALEDKGEDEEEGEKEDQDNKSDSKRKSNSGRGDQPIPTAKELSQGSSQAKVAVASDSKIKGCAVMKSSMCSIL